MRNCMLCTALYSAKSQWKKFFVGGGVTHFVCGGGGHTFLYLSGGIGGDIFCMCRGGSHILHVYGGGVTHFCTCQGV